MKQRFPPSRIQHPTGKEEELYTCRTGDALPFRAAEESPPRTHLAFGINQFLVQSFSRPLEKKIRQAGNPPVIPLHPVQGTRGV